MTFLIPMAGHGKRFKEEGYILPKYMIKVKGITLFEYSINSLPIEIADKLIFICLKEHTVFNVKEFIKSKVNHNNINITMIDNPTRGQAETALIAKEFIDHDDELLIYNIDTYFISSNIKNKLLDTKYKKDGILGAFMNTEDDEKWSFAQLDKYNNVIKTAEKEQISNYALTGLYHFTLASSFFDVAQKWINANKLIKNEFYIAPMYNDLIYSGKKFTIDIADSFTPLGTPKDIKNFELQN